MHAQCRCTKRWQQHLKLLDQEQVGLLKVGVHLRVIAAVHSCVSRYRKVPCTSAMNKAAAAAPPAAEAAAAAVRPVDGHVRVRKRLDSFR
jgi:hypothetical protein